VKGDSLNSVFLRLTQFRVFINIRLMSYCFRIVLVFLFLFSASNAQQSDAAQPVLRWYDLKDFGIEGKGWTETKSFYDRLPAKAEAIVRAPVWKLSLNSAGMSVRFVTDADTIYARWKLRSPSLALAHMAASGVSGVDLYVKENGFWRWIGIGEAMKSSINEYKLIGNIAPRKREYQLYLPLYNGVESVEIGLPEKAAIEKAVPYPAERAKPIVFYGTSIVQGAVASRPGMAYPAILGRRFQRPTINLGFSGNGRMEPEMAELLTELDAAVYVIDCLPNLSTGAEVGERTPKLIEIILKKRSVTPIILVENLAYPNAMFEQIKQQKYRDKNETLRRVYQNLIRSKFKNIYYVSGENLIGSDGEATVDGIHPTDLGFMRIADTLEPILKKALRNQR
jgi:lysophospholipase L1-like esterase